MCAQIAYNRGLVSMEERNRVFRVMKRLQLPFWHPVCCTQLFYKVPHWLILAVLCKHLALLAATSITAACHEKCTCLQLGACRLARSCT